MPEPPIPPGFTYPPLGILDAFACVIVLAVAIYFWRAARREITRYRRITWR